MHVSRSAMLIHKCVNVVSNEHTKCEHTHLSTYEESIIFLSFSLLQPILQRIILSYFTENIINLQYITKPNKLLQILRYSLFSYLKMTFARPKLQSDLSLASQFKSISFYKFITSCT